MLPLTKQVESLEKRFYRLEGLTGQILCALETSAYPTQTLKTAEGEMRLIDALKIWKQRLSDLTI